MNAQGSVIAWPSIFLASASPRRSQLLTQIGVPHTIRPADIDERRRTTEAPADYVTRLAATKAQALWSMLAANERMPTLGADTTVALGDEIFGKPENRDAGIAMLQRLSGTTHHVFTAIALQSTLGCETALSISEVTFASLRRDDCEAYWESGEPVGKAGGYAVQGLAAIFITRIAGSYSGIMGLPLAETAQLLKRTMR